MKTKVSFLTIVATLGLAIITTAQTLPSNVPTSGLIGWWAFNGNANDASGNNLNGVVTGALLTSDRLGNLNSAYNFNYLNWSWGSGGDKIFIPYNQIMNTTNLSVSAWVNRSSNGYLNQGHTIINRFQFGYSNPNGQAWQIVAEAAPSSLIKTQVLQAAPNNNQVNIVNTGPILTQNSWFHICMTFNGTSVKQFVNGVLVDSIPANSLALNSVGNSGISIGVSDQANGHWGPFDGKIDDIGIWNRALTTQEIALLYNECQLTFISQPSSQIININTNVDFIAVSSDPNSTYQWQTDLGVGFQNLNSVGQYSGTTNDTMTVSNVSIINNNQPFRCITNSGSCFDTSDIAILTINNNVGIIENPRSNLFSVFPNPTQSIINLKVESILLDSDYRVYNSVGNVVLSGKVESEITTIEFSNLPIGIYLINVGQNLNGAHKIVKK